MPVATVHAVVSAPELERELVHGRCVDAVRASEVSSQVVAPATIEVSVDFRVRSVSGTAFERRVQQVQRALGVAVDRPITWKPVTTRVD